MIAKASSLSTTLTCKDHLTRQRQKSNTTSAQADADKYKRGNQQYEIFLRKFRQAEIAEHEVRYKRPCLLAGPFDFLAVLLAGDYIGRTRAFFALSDFELDFLAFIE